MQARTDLADRTRRRGSASILLTGLFCTALAQDRVGAYDFAYRLSGDARAKPVQVFDDGKDTFFQFRAGEPVPAIFADGPAGPRLLPPQSEGPYVKVAAVADGFALRLGLGAATASYIGAPRRREAATPATPEPVRRTPTPAPPQALQLAASLPVSGLPRELLMTISTPRITLEEGSYATPLRGDAIEWTASPERVRLIEIVFGKDSAVLTSAAARLIRSIVAEARSGSRFELPAVDDGVNNTGLGAVRSKAVEAALLAAGAAVRSIIRTATPGDAHAANSVSLRVIDPTTGAVARPPRQHAAAPATVAEVGAPGAAPQQPPAVWAVRKADGTLDRMLARWARDAGWTLVWQDGPSVAITGDASLSRPDYIQAADYALEQARGAGYRLRATAYRNQVLVVTSEE